MRRLSLLLGGVIVLVAIVYGYSRLNTGQTVVSYRLETCLLYTSPSPRD